MRYRYYTVDVFTDTRFGGNQLAVLPAAEGLSGALMQRITREFNYAETTFLLPPADAANDAHVRIFTPAREVPFAGHPYVGTAFVLAARETPPAPGAAGERTLRFESAAGLVPVRVRFAAGAPVFCELTAPAAFRAGAPVAPEPVAAALGIETRDVVARVHPPRVASVGLPFVFAEVRDRAVLARAEVRLDRFRACADAAGADTVFVYTTETGDPELDVRGRLFAPLHGVGEDPATGSAACALAALLADARLEGDGELRLRIAQGVEMGRPSRLLAAAVKAGGAVREARVGGASVAVAEGWIEVG